MDRTRRSRIPLVIVVSLAALALGGTGGNAAAVRAGTKPPTETVPGELLIGFRGDVAAADQNKVLKAIGAAERRSFNKIHGKLAHVSPDAVGAALDKLRHDPRVRYAEPNFVVHADALPNDPSFGQLWGLNNTGQAIGGFPGTPDADIDAPEAWSVTTGSRNVTVAVIDTGVDWSHPDLSSQIWVNPGENCAGCRNDGIDNDHNGYVDDWHGWNFVNNTNNPMDDHGHGTHVAGTIGAAGNNGIGVTGINWNVQIMPVKFLNAQGSGTTADAVSAVLYAANSGADVMNNSWAGGEYSQALADAIAVADQHNSLFVAAAGNDGTDNDAHPTYPASYDNPNVVSVAATDNTDNVAYFSNFGRRSVDLGAPGVNIYSTWPGNSYQSLSGTSMATPHVAGAAALAKAEFPSASAVGLKALLLDSVDPNRSLTGQTTTGGRLNAATAVACSGSPKVWIDSPGAGFAVPTGTPISFTAIATNCADSAGVAVSANVNGSPVMLSPRGDGFYTGTYTPTARGAVTFSVTASVGANSMASSVTGSATQAYPITAGGPPVTVTSTSSGEKIQLTFGGQVGQRVSLAMSAVSIPTSQVSILNPDGSTLATTYVFTGGGFLDTRTLPVAGTYTIVVAPFSPSAGSMTLTLYDVPADAGGAITPGGAPSSVSISIPGQNARMSFGGTAGQRVSMQLSGVTISLATVSILKPDGSTLASTYAGTSGTFVDTVTLPSAGTYAIMIDPQGAAVGSATMTLYDVPPDGGGTITAGGPPASVSTSVPGQNGRLTFDGRAGQRVSVTISSVTFSNATVSIVAPDGSRVGGNTVVGSGGAFMDARSLPTTGTYAIVVDPYGTTTGSAAFTLYDVPSDVSGALTPGGPPLSVSMTTPGQNAKITFDGQAGRRISLKIGSSTLSAAYVSITKPDGSSFVGNTIFSTSDAFVDTRTLPVSGTYTIGVDPYGAATGSAAFTLYDVPPDAGGSMTPGGPSLSVGMTTPGQNAKITFDGQAGQRISLKLGPSTMSAAYVSIAKPDGSSFVGNTIFSTSEAFVDTRTLPVAGTYTITVDPMGTATGSATLTLYDVPADATGSVSVGGAPVTVSIGTPGQNARISLAGRAGQTVSLKLSSVTISIAYASILKPDGTTLVSPSIFSTGGRTIAATLPADGNYTIVIDPMGSATGSLALTLS